MSLSFPPRCERHNQSEDTPHEASQSVHGGGRRSSTNVSHRDQGGGGGAGFRDKQVTSIGARARYMQRDRSTQLH